MHPGWPEPLSQVGSLLTMLRTFFCCVQGALLAGTEGPPGALVLAGPAMSEARTARALSRASGCVGFLEGYHCPAPLSACG